MKRDRPGQEIEEGIEQSIPKRFLGFIYAEGRQALKRIIQQSMNFQIFSVKFYVIASIHVHFYVYTYILMKT